MVNDRPSEITENSGGGEYTMFAQNKMRFLAVRRPPFLDTPGQTEKRETSGIHSCQGQVHHFDSRQLDFEAVVILRFGRSSEAS